MSRLFGTDGVRGLANASLTPEFALSLSMAAAHELGPARLAVVGRDPRASGEMLEAAVVAGLASAGVEVLRLGVVPTPAVAYLTVALGADLGVMISASHNPMPDNGIKFFDRSGFKLADDVEDAIAARQDSPLAERPTGAAVGRVRDVPDAVSRYVDHVVSAAPHRLDGLRVVVDCAHGAASFAAPEALRRAGATVEAVNASPDGLNINDGCGSTHPDVVAAAVRASGADVGIAHDGDADRCIAVTAAGDVVDGDAILAVCALGLSVPAVVTTVMTNLGFKQAMAARGVSVVETAVGDRYVLEAMRSAGITLGGEQSGHLIFLDHATTGDGILAALHLLGQLAATGRSLAELAGVLTRLPQVLVNVPAERSVLDQPAVRTAIDEASASLGTSGRVLVRPSGTEPVVRVMVEAADEATARSVANGIAELVRALGG